jgi:hypothetical protein
MSKWQVLTLSFHHSSKQVSRPVKKARTSRGRQEFYDQQKQPEKKEFNENNSNFHYKKYPASKIQQKLA